MKYFCSNKNFVLENATKRKKLSPKKDIDLKKCFLITDFTGKNFLSLLEQNKRRKIVGDENLLTNNLVRRNNKK